MATVWGRGRSEEEAGRGALLEALGEAGAPVSRIGLQATLTTRGLASSDRSLRLSLAQLCAEGLTASDRQRYRLTDAGRAELQAATAPRRLGLLSAKMAALGCQIDLDLSKRRGRLVVDVGLVPIEELGKAQDRLSDFLSRRLGGSARVGLLPPGERFGEFSIPAETAGICTVGLGTLTGLLLRRGIPSRPRLAGILEFKAGKPVRFSEFIHYDATTVDPVEVFFRSRLLDCRGGEAGCGGRLGASLLEVPAQSRDAVVFLDKELMRAGLGAALRVGLPGQSLFDVPVAEGYAGVVSVAGLNPLSVLWENESPFSCRLFSGLMDYRRLFHFSELSGRISDLTA